MDYMVIFTLKVAEHVSITFPVVYPLKRSKLTERIYLIYVQFIILVEYEIMETYFPWKRTPDLSFWGFF